jgi:hypothetical protein
MKLAAGYVVFDSLETLEWSIRSIRSNVDIVIVSYQLISWRGRPASAELIPTLERLKAQGLIDHIIEFSKFQASELQGSAQVMAAKMFELSKRQGCLELARSLGATHYMSIDADEFYRENELSWAKQEIIDKQLDATAVRYINYVTPTLHRGYSRWRIPFIYRITPKSVHHANQLFFKGVDPTRGLTDDSYSKIRIFEEDRISMHHMEMVRKDILSKYINSSRYFESRGKIFEVERDILESIQTGVLNFKGQHLGDSPNPRENYPLTPCDNEFGIEF